MDFESMNPFNIWLNLLSGNLLPINPDKSSFSIYWKIHCILAWSVEIISIVLTIFGCFFIPIEKIVNDVLLIFVITAEGMFMVMRMLMQEKLMKQLIRALNNFMRIKDTMKDDIIERNLNPMKIPFRFYLVMGLPSVFVYCVIPFSLAFEKSSFYYVDFKMPIIFVKEPFSVGFFILGNTMVLITNIYIFIKKVSVDVYVTYLIALITAQYQYIATKLVLIFQDDNPQKNYISLSEDHYFKINSSAEKKIGILCRQHISVIRITIMLRKLMSLSFSLIYVNNVFRFCFLGIMLTRISASLIEGLMVFMYGSGAVVQFYILCSSIQKLLEASAAITDKAFHEDWNRFKISVKRTFMLVMMASNNLEIKLAAFEKFNLSLPSFMTVLNQAYSFALLILRVN